MIHLQILAAVVLVTTLSGADEHSTENSIEHLVQAPAVQALLERIETADPDTLREQRLIAEIPSPPFKEQERAAHFLNRLKEFGFKDAYIDVEGNVIALRKGTGGESVPTLVLSAHLDTVFPEGTDVTVSERDGRLYGRGLADDSRGLAVILTIARLLENEQLRIVGDIMFVGTVGEEGEGNLRGVRTLIRDHPQIDGFISVDLFDVPPVVPIANGATAVRRWHVIFKGPGGHSFVDFGRPSAVHAMGRAIDAISDLRPPADPRTTFTVGVAKGGTSVNAIAAEAAIDIDIRSNEMESLRELESEIMNAIDISATAEGQRWDAAPIEVTRELIGERPGGMTPPSSAMVRMATAATAAIGSSAPYLVHLSTDSNVPIGAGIPAVTLSGGGRGGNLHSPDEWYRNTNAWHGVQRVALTVLSLVGVEGLIAPMLEKRRKEDR